MTQDKISRSVCALLLIAIIAAFSIASSEDYYEAEYNRVPCVARVEIQNKLHSDSPVAIVKEYKKNKDYYDGLEDYSR